MNFITKHWGKTIKLSRLYDVTLYQQHTKDKLEELNKNNNSLLRLTSKCSTQESLKQLKLKNVSRLYKAMPLQTLYSSFHYISGHETWSETPKLVGWH